MTKPVVIFSANRGYALKSSRAEIITHFLDRNWQVVLATSDDEESRELCRLGAKLEPVIFSRGSLSLRTDTTAYYRLLSIFQKYRPSLVHNFHAKPVILGIHAARRALGNSVAIVNSITGLGQAFVSGGLISSLAGIGYRTAIPKADITVFQNRDDQSLFLKNKWVKDINQRLIVGSGINLERFTPVDRSQHDMSSPTIIMLGRLLTQKGVSEFIEVATRVRNILPNARFVWAGEEDPIHPSAVSGHWMAQQECIDYIGRLSDVLPLLKSADLLLFTSYYREGVPRVVMEAAASGLPTIGFNVPGVREAIKHGQTGFLVNERDIDSMTEYVFKVINDSELRLRMGRSARTLSEKSFDIKAIQSKYLNLYRELGAEI